MNKRATKYLFIIPGAIFIAGTVLTFQIEKRQRELACVALQNRFDSQVVRITGLLTSRIQAVENLLRTSRGFFETSPTLQSPAWTRYTETVVLEQRHAGLLMFGFMPKKSWVGNADPDRRQAAEQARDTGTAVLTGKVSLTPEGLSRKGVLLFLPVYRRGIQPSALSERRAYLEGWMYAAISPKDLFQDVYQRHASDIHLEIFDGAPVGDKFLLFDGVPLVPREADHIPLFTATAKPVIGGRLWTLRFIALPTFDKRLDQTQSPRDVMAGVAVSALIAALSWSLLTTRARALRMADHMTQSLFRSEEIARQAEKMSAVGQLAAGIAHEINNPLGVILAYSQSVLKRVSLDDALEVPLKSIEREAIRCKNLVQDLLTFSRVSKSERQLLDLNQAVESVLTLISIKAKMTGNEVRKELAGELPSLLGNTNQIQEIVLNLANNAIDALGEHGTVTIKTELASEADSSWICLRISDTGAGIPAEVLPRIFEPFFTTKPIGKGTGLGLALVHELVSRHTGKIEVQSRPGYTEFCVKFPVPAGEERTAASRKLPMAA